MADCCTEIKSKIWDVTRHLEDAADEHVDYYLQRLRDIMRLPPGAYVTLPGGQVVPSLREILQRLATPLNRGATDWYYYNAKAGRVQITLPRPVPHPGVSLNGATLATPKDYSFVGASLHFTHPLDVGDLVRVHNYGA